VLSIGPPTLVETGEIRGPPFLLLDRQTGQTRRLEETGQIRGVPLTPGVVVVPTRHLGGNPVAKIELFAMFYLPVGFYTGSTSTNTCMVALSATFISQIVIGTIPKEEDLEVHHAFLPEYRQFIGIIQYMIYGHGKQNSETVEYTITRDGGERWNEISPLCTTKEARRNMFRGKKNGNQLRERM
jgi:hypothetical protein